MANKGVGEGYAGSMGEEVLHRLEAPFDELIQRRVILLDQLVYHLPHSPSHPPREAPPIRSVGALACPVRWNTRAGSTVGSAPRPENAQDMGLYARGPHEGLRLHYKD